MRDKSNRVAPAVFIRPTIFDRRTERKTEQNRVKRLTPVQDWKWGKRLEMSKIWEMSEECEYTQENIKLDKVLKRESGLYLVKNEG